MDFQTPTTPVPGSTAASAGSAHQDAQEAKECSCNPWLLPHWLQKGLPAEDRAWVSQALFHLGPGGRPELNPGKVDRLWYSPPQPFLHLSVMPCPDRYFAHRLCLWVPRTLWGYPLVCPQPVCGNRELTSAGLYHNARQLWDVDSVYLLLTECLECGGCGRKLPSWQDSLVAQLDLGHRHLFPAVLMDQGAADQRVVCLLRQPGPGYTALQVRKTLREQHSAAWLQKSALYMTHVKSFKAQASSGGRVSSVEPEAPPHLPSMPGVSWLRSVYIKDVLLRLDHVKASITSTFGSILKLASMKKAVKKVAAWHTSVGNEHGQVLISVATAEEGGGLAAMAEGLMGRYSAVGVEPPQVLYVSKDCCSGTPGERGPASKLFGSWTSLQVRLDPCHFMRLLVSAVTSESHPLYGQFVGALSLAIFAWDSEDLDNLKAAKRAQFRQEGVEDPSEGAIEDGITKKELTLHCRQTTRGTEETTRLIDSLLSAYTHASVADSWGVPLLDRAKVKAIWGEQRRHVACLQDPEGVALYRETAAPVRMGGRLLRSYRCARGSTSLRPFHRHLTRCFSPGSSASALHHQLCLVEGLSCWNQDHAHEALGLQHTPRIYNAWLCHGINQLSMQVFKKPVFPGLSTPSKYTGELIGMEYLYSQNSGTQLYSFAEEPSADADAEVPEVEENEEGEEASLEELMVAPPQQTWEEQHLLPRLQQVILQAPEDGSEGSLPPQPLVTTSGPTIPTPPSPSTSQEETAADLCADHALPGPTCVDNKAVAVWKCTCAASEEQLEESGEEPRSVAGDAAVLQLAAELLSLKQFGEHQQPCCQDHGHVQQSASPQQAVHHLPTLIQGLQGEGGLQEGS